MKPCYLVALVVITPVLTACSGTEWIDIPGPLGEKCSDVSIEEFSGRDNEFAAGYCVAQQQQATGKARCDGDRLQIECE
ncbi:MAG: hypothetical protein KJO66_00455 [Gammaproteobacteria bacterium]|nr:hypothetical protein [Gammaproteobacteria bacterium]NNJ94941.1 hypothetical protein [Halobacteria archaeon]